MEPHRDYDRDSGIRAGRNPADVVVPKYLPDHDVVRRDLLDYALAVERADELCGRALEVLEAAGELDNTLVVMTSDHGIPFPRARARFTRMVFICRWQFVGQNTCGRAEWSTTLSTSATSRRPSWPPRG